MPGVRYIFLTFECTAVPKAWVLETTPAAPSQPMVKSTYRVCGTNLSTLEVTAAPKAWAFGPTPDYHSGVMVRLWYKFVNL